MNEAITINASMIIWSSITSIMGILGIAIGYLFKSKMKTIESNISEIKKEQKESTEDKTKCKLNIANNFLLRKDFNTGIVEVKKDFNKDIEKIEKTQAGVFKRIDDLKDVVNKNHLEIVSQIKAQNGKQK